MINLEKEEKAFEAYMNIDECEKDDVFISECNGWLARAMFENQEISQLKAKLAKYESEEVVVVPRIPTQEILDALESGIYWDYADTTFDPNVSYKAMIEIGEIK